MKAQKVRWPTTARALYLVTDPHFVSAKDISHAVNQAVRGGASLVQLRDKAATTRELVNMATRLVERTKVPVIVNDRVDVALAANAAGVHLGQTDMQAKMARAILGDGALIGLSIEAMTDLDDTENLAAVDYLAVSPVFTTATKPDAAPPLGLAGVSAVVERTQLPVVGIGGVTPANCDAVYSAGASAVAVVSAILGANDIEAAARAFGPDSQKLERAS